MLLLSFLCALRAVWPSSAGPAGEIVDASHHRCLDQLLASILVHQQPPNGRCRHGRPRLYKPTSQRASLGRDPLPQHRDPKIQEVPWPRHWRLPLKLRKHSFGSLVGNPSSLLTAVRLHLQQQGPLLQLQLRLEHPMVQLKENRSLELLESNAFVGFSPGAKIMHYSEIPTTAKNKTKDCSYCQPRCMILLTSCATMDAAPSSARTRYNAETFL